MRGRLSGDVDMGMIVALAVDAILFSTHALHVPTMAKSDRRYTLLIYARLFGQWRVPALLITLVFVALAWLAPGPLADESVRAALVLGATAGLLLFGYAL